METILVIGLAVLIIAINIFILRYIISKSYYFTKNEISILTVGFKKQKGLIDSRKYKSILTTLNSKK